MKREDIRLAASLLGMIGGSKTSEKKARAARENGSKPCHPGKKRGRPPKKKPEAKGE